MSLIITIIDFIICLFGVSIIFSKEENLFQGTIKNFITNPEKTVFMAKSIMLLVLGIDHLIGNTRAILPLFAFSLGSLIFYSYFNTHLFFKSNDLRQLFNYSLSLIYFLSGLFVLIAYVLKDYEKKGYFYFYILFCIIFLFIINHSVFKVKIINFRDSYNKLNEFEIFLHYRNILVSIENKNYNRELMLNFFEYLNYSNYNKINEESILHEENENYNLYCIIEKSLKRRMVLYKNSLLLKILHYIILRKYLRNHKSAYLLLYQLNYDLEKNIINGNLSEKFFIFRIKKTIEDDSINFNLDKTDISIRYQMNTLIDLIINVTELYFSFWNYLLSSRKNNEMKRISEIGSIIHKLIINIQNKFEEIEKNIKFNNKRLILLYGIYLRDILNDKEKAEKYLKTDLIEKNTKQSKYKNKNDFIPSSEFQFGIISLSRISLGIIEKISKEFSLKLGYRPNELIGKNIKILFPSLLNEKVKEMLKDIFNDLYHYKNKKKIYYLKTKSKYIEAFPIETSIQFDEEHNNFLLCKLDMTLFLNKKIDNVCHILTDNNFVINLFSSNSIHLLDLTSKFICDSIDISMLIEEFHDDIIKISNNKYLGKLKLLSLKNSIMENKFLHYENEIKWSLNNKFFKMKSETILMNNILIGYYFHLNYIPYDDIKGNTIIQISNSITKEIFNKFQQRLIKGKTVIKKITNGNLKKVINHEKYEIDGDFIPELGKEINYYPKEGKYYFDGNTQLDNIHNYFQKFILNPKYRRDRKKLVKNQINIYSNSEDSSYNSISDSDIESYENSSDNSSFDLNIKNNEKNIKKIKSPKSKSYRSPKNNVREKLIKFNNEEMKSIKFSPRNNDKKRSHKSSPNSYDGKKSHKSSFISNDGKKSNKSSSKIINLIEIHDDNFYKINYQNMNFFIYDFIEHRPLEIKPFEVKSKVEQLIHQEKMLTKSLKQKYTYLNKSNEKKLIKKIKTKEEKEKKEGKIEINYDTPKFLNLNIYIIFWMIILIISFILIILIGIIYFHFSFLIGEKIIQTLKIHNYLNDLMKNSNRVFFYSYELIILKNELYKKFGENKDDSKNYSRNILNDIYNKFIVFLDSINNFIPTLSNKNKIKIENYYLELRSINDKLERNITKSKVVNIVEEFIFSIYSFMNLNDKDLNFYQRDFNFILSNYEVLLIDYLFEFAEIFLDEFEKLKKKLYLLALICFILFLSVIIISYYLQIKIIAKIILNQEKTTNIFFKINPDYIINAINNCEIFIELNRKELNNPEHLISNPCIKISQKGNTDYSSSFEETDDLIVKKKNIEFESISNILRKKENKKFDLKKIDFNYLIILTIPIIIMLVIILFITIDQMRQYMYIYYLSKYYFLILNQYTFLIKYYNYFRTLLCYYAYIETNEQIKKINNNLYNVDLFNINQMLFNDIYNSMKKNKNDEIVIFNDIVFGDICEYFEVYSNIYNITCNDIGDGIIRYGIYSISIYILQLIVYLINYLKDIIEKGKLKGFKYDEIYYSSNKFNELYPENESLWKEYETLNPFLVINHENNFYLSIIIGKIVKNALDTLDSFFNNKIISIINELKKKLIFIEIILLFLFILNTFILIFPRIIRKNNEIIEEKNMLKIIPKKELEQILIKEDIN